MNAQQTQQERDRTTQQGNPQKADPNAGKMRIIPENTGDSADWHESARMNLKRQQDRDTVEKTGPRSSVG